MTSERAAPGPLRQFQVEARQAARYERGLALKAAGMLIVVIAIVVIRQLYLT